MKCFIFPYKSQKGATVANLEGVLQGLSDAPEAEVVILPELWDTGFYPEIDLASLQREAEIIEIFCREARERAQWFVLGSIVSADRTNRSYVIAPDGSVRNVYDKRHLFVLTEESKRFLAGTEQSRYDLVNFRTSTHLCFDLRFPENDRDLDLLIIPASWPSVRTYHWESLLRARAIENQCYVIGVNSQSESFVFDPMGEIVARGDKPFFVDLELRKVKEVKAWMPIS